MDILNEMFGKHFSELTKDEVIQYIERIRALERSAGACASQEDTEWVKNPDGSINFGFDDDINPDTHGDFQTEDKHKSVSAARRSGRKFPQRYRVRGKNQVSMASIRGRNLKRMQKRPIKGKNRGSNGCERKQENASPVRLITV